MTTTRTQTIDDIVLRRGAHASIDEGACDASRGAHEEHARREGRRKGRRVGRRRCDLGLDDARSPDLRGVPYRADGRCGRSIMTDEAAAERALIVAWLRARRGLSGDSALLEALRRPAYTSALTHSTLTAPAGVNSQVLTPDRADATDPAQIQGVTSEPGS